VAAEQPDVDFPAPPPLPASADVEGYALHRQVQGRASQIDACYWATLEKEPGLRGILKLDLTVRETGRPTKVRVRLGPERNRALERCVTRTVRKWRFVRSTEGALKLSVPFVYGLSEPPE